MTERYSCSTCAFMRMGKVRDRYSHKLGWITHNGALCNLHAPYKSTQNPVEPDGICSRWTDKETLEQPLAHLCPSLVTMVQEPQSAPAKNGTMEVKA